MSAPIQEFTDFGKVYGFVMMLRFTEKYNMMELSSIVSLLIDRSIDLGKGVIDELYRSQKLNVRNTSEAAGQ